MTRRRLAALLTLLVAAPLHAQTGEVRHELGRHLRAFEDALDAQPDEAARQRALATVKPVTAAFFSFQFGKAAQVLDQARLDLASDKKPEPVVAWAQSVSVTPTARLLDTNAGNLPVKASAFYKAGGQPEKFQVRLTLTKPDGSSVAGPAVLDGAALPFEGKLPFQGVPEGDYVLRSEVLVDGKPLAVVKEGVSLADRLDGRLEKLNAAVKALDDKVRSTDRETVQRLAKLLTALRDKEPQETDYPAARLLAETEAAAQAVAAGKPFYGQKKPGEFYLTLATEKDPAVVRLSAPGAAAKGEPLPLVIALHGAGGSENLFFDGHGGMIVRLARERGWLVVAPRNGLPADLVEAVDRLYPVDRKRVFLVGHSMGAARAVQAASAQPERYAAVGVLGGGGVLRPSAALKDLPFFVGVGGADTLMLQSAQELTAALKKAEVKKVVYKEYPGVEHLTVVQLGLKDVYAFFDEAMKK
jgi:predicted esterase